MKNLEVVQHEPVKKKTFKDKMALVEQETCFPKLVVG